jgi:hypothetical protein
MPLAATLVLAANARAFFGKDLSQIDAAEAGMLGRLVR